MNPRITVLTVTRNRAAMLADAIESVRAQTGASVEHIVVDGMSSDATPALLARSPHLRVVREPDEGLYDALNKALRLATGDLVGFLNDDDRYAPGALRAVAAAHEGFDVVTGGALVLDDRGRVTRSWVGARETALTAANVLMRAPLLNARFFRRAWLARVGDFDTSYAIAADRAWMLRVCLEAPRERVIPEVIYRYRAHDGSLTLDRAQRHLRLARTEHVRIAEATLERLPDDHLARGEIERFHAWECLCASILCARGGRADESLAYLRRGIARDPRWPVAVASRLVRRALAR